MKKVLCVLLVWVRRHITYVKLCRWIEKKIAKLDGGFYYSSKIRELYEELYGLTIGYGTYGGCWNNSALWWNNIVIGNYCSFAGDVSLFPYDHPTDLFTTHPIIYDTFSAGARKNYIGWERQSLHIGHGVWFGNNSIVLSGCKIIGNGAIIGAGSVVTHDVPPYAIVVGNPAKILRYRLTPEQIKKVERTQWWLLGKDELNDKMDEFLRLTSN